MSRRSTVDGRRSRLDQRPPVRPSASRGGRRRSSASRLALLLPLIGLLGCARPLVRPDPRLVASLAGVWDLVERAVDAEGDERIDRHEWQLQERGGQLLGFWNRSRTWSSADGRPFACNQQLRYTESGRHWLKGSLVGGAVKATVTGWFRDPGPCQGGLPPVQSCRLLPRGRRQLLVDCGAGPMLLQRRLDDPVPLELAERRPGSLTGVWTWQLRSTDPEGDLKQEVEVWQLRQRGEQIEGHYDRLVVVRSSDGRRFQCNQQLQYRSQARFRVRGWVRGQQLQLEETGFTASPDRCETGYRSLDRYQGRVDPDGEIITLTWGRGAQLLYRRY